MYTSPHTHTRLGLPGLSLWSCCCLWYSYMMMDELYPMLYVCMDGWMTPIVFKEGRNRSIDPSERGDGVDVRSFVSRVDVRFVSRVDGSRGASVAGVVGSTWCAPRCARLDTPLFGRLIFETDCTSVQHGGWWRKEKREIVE